MGGTGQISLCLPIPYLRYMNADLVACSVCEMFGGVSGDASHGGSAAAAPGRVEARI